MNRTASEEITLGYYLSKQGDSFHLDLGIRHDRTSRKGSVRHEEEHDEHAEEQHEEHEELPLIQH